MKKKSQKNNELNKKQHLILKTLEYIFIFIVLLIIINIGVDYRNTTNELPITDNWVKSQTDQQIEGISSQFKDRFKDENGQTYLLAIDPYLYLRYSEDVIEHGYPGDNEVNEKLWDSHSLAPTGREVQKEQFNFYLTSFLYKIFSFFDKNVTPMKVLFNIPIYLFILSTIGIFFLARRIGGLVAGIFSSLIFAIHPFVLTRGVAGFYDPTLYTFLFPIIAIWLLIESFLTKNKLLPYIFSFFSALSVGLFTFALEQSKFVYFSLIISLASISLYILIYELIHENKDKTRFFNTFNSIKTFSIFLVFATLFVFLFGGFTTQNETIGQSFWPSASETIAGMNPQSLSQYLSTIGGIFDFSTIIMGLIFLFINRKESKLTDVIIDAILIFIIGFISLATTSFSKLGNTGSFILILSILLIFFGLTGIVISIIRKRFYNPIFYLLLIPWTLYAINFSTEMIKFMILTIAPLCLLFGIAAGSIVQFFGSFYDFILTLFKKDFNKIIVLVIKIVILVSISSSLFLAFFLPTDFYIKSHSIVNNQIPSFNDAWYESLAKIKQQSSEDAIITSWWDFGHWFTQVADRGVTFDGQTQNTPQLYWVSRILTTSNENEAIGVLRMLNCGGNSAFDKINQNLNNEMQSLELIKEIILLDKQDAELIIKNKNIDPNILELTHCNPPEAFFITSEDMVGKSGVWAHFGTWDFEISNAKWPAYQSGELSCKLDQSDILNCENGAQINLETKEIKISSYGKDINPVKASFYINNQVDNIIYNNEPNSKKDIGAIVISTNQPNNYKLILSNPTLTDSLFTKLFFADGIGLEHFNKFNDVNSVTGQRIIVWKVNW